MTNTPEITREVPFAPDGVVMPNRDVDEAVRLANDARYALNVYVWGPTADAIEVAAHSLGHRDALT